MKITLQAKKLSKDITKEEIVVINAIISSIEFTDLVNILSKRIDKNKLISILKSLCEKEIIWIDNPEEIGITKKSVETAAKLPTKTIDNNFKKPVSKVGKVNIAQKIADYKKTISQTKPIKTDNNFKKPVNKVTKVNIAQKIADYKKTISQTKSVKKIDKNEKISSVDVKKDIDNLYQNIMSDNIYYKILGLTQNCSISEIKKRYFELSKKFHPDIVFKHNLSGDYGKKVEDIALKISNIYNVLKSKKLRRKYDQEIEKLNESKKIKKIDPKAEEFYLLASTEYGNKDFKKAYKLIKISLSYSKKYQKALTLKEDIEQRLDEQKRVEDKRLVEKSIELQDYDKALEIIDQILEKRESVNTLIQKIDVLTMKGFKKNRDQIFEIYKKVITKSPKNVIIRERYIQFLKDGEFYEKIEEQIEALLDLDPKNKFAKKLKKRSIWNMFSVLI